MNSWRQYPPNAAPRGGQLDHHASNVTNDLDLKNKVFKRSITFHRTKPKKDKVKADCWTTDQHEVCDSMRYFKTKRPMQVKTYAKRRTINANGGGQHKRSNLVETHRELSLDTEELLFSLLGIKIVMLSRCQKKNKLLSNEKGTLSGELIAT